MTQTLTTIGHRTAFNNEQSPYRIVSYNRPSIAVSSSATVTAGKAILMSRFPRISSQARQKKNQQVLQEFRIQRNSAWNSSESDLTIEGSKSFAIVKFSSVYHHHQRVIVLYGQYYGTSLNIPRILFREALSLNPS